MIRAIANSTVEKPAVNRLRNLYAVINFFAPIGHTQRIKYFVYRGFNTPSFAVVPLDSLYSSAPGAQNCDLIQLYALSLKELTTNHAT